MNQSSRIQLLNKNQLVKGDYVLYWMQASQRAEYNHALEFAISQANKMRLPVLVYFGLTDNFPEANERHYHFMLEGLKYVQKKLHDRGICMIIRHTSPEIGAVELARKASFVVCDRGYLRIQKQWRNFVAEKIACPLVQVETDVIVPVEVASSHEEYSAATLRRKVQKLLPYYLKPVQHFEPLVKSLDYAVEDHIIISDINTTLRTLNIDRSVKPVKTFSGGTAEARKWLKEFVSKKLERYHKCRFDPNDDCLSNLSPYLHFGQISPLEVALEATKHDGPGTTAFLEELIIRRELSINFVHYNRHYDTFDGLPRWAQETLFKHRNDPRDYVYTPEQLETAQTHDAYWNAAQIEMVTTGKMHSYMRMYWCKKIIEWSDSPDKAFTLACYLNNRYELDGRDPNSFGGVAWCFGKHDRPWAERAILGNVRCMTANGLKRKFDAEKYAQKYNKKS